MTSDGQFKQGEKEDAQGKSNDGEKNKSNGGKQERTTGQEQGKKVRFGEEEPLEETRAESTDEPEVRGIFWQRKCRPRPRGDERCRADESRRKGKRKG